MIVDHGLLDRLDRVAARLALEMVDGYRRAEPGGPATSRSFGAGALVALGPGRWVNRAIGVSPLDDPSMLEELERFFIEAGVPPSLEIGTWAAPSDLGALSSRGYTVAWLRDVFVLVSASPPARAESEVLVREVDPSGADEWVDVFTRAFGGDEPAEVANAELHATAIMLTPSTTHFVASIGDDIVGCASLSIVDGVAWLGGAATLLAHRDRGVQTALLGHRLGVAADAGCAVAAATATPSGPSARNLRRSGFTLATAQAVLTRDLRDA